MGARVIWFRIGDAETGSSGSGCDLRMGSSGSGQFDGEPKAAARPHIRGAARVAKRALLEGIPERALGYRRSCKMSLDDLIGSAWVSGYGTSLMDAQDAFDFFDGESDRPQA